jgi:hypothetical protein
MESLADHTFDGVAEGDFIFDDDSDLSLEGEQDEELVK